MSANIYERVADFLFPPQCLACHVHGSWCCEACQEKMQVLPLGWCGNCDRIGVENTTICKRCSASLGIRTLIGCYRYEGTTEQVVQSIKFRPAAVGVGTIADTAIVQERFSMVEKPCVLIPIPCSNENERRRGFNQALLLAKELASSDPNVEILDKLVRTRETKAQVGLHAKERKANAEQLYIWKGASLRGRRCVLIDDVATTGATLSDAARALKEHGAREISAFVLAQTPPRKS